MNRFTRTLLLLTLLLAALLTPGTISAQGPPPPGCDPAMLTEQISTIQQKLAQAQALLSDNDTEGALEAFNEAGMLVDEVRGMCGGITVSVGIAEPGVIEAVPPVMVTDVLCSQYPMYCVPMVGGGPDYLADYPNETPDLRPTTNADMSMATPGVVRGLTADGAPFIGNPDAPIHFLGFMDFACPHCVAFETETLTPFIEHAIASGLATYEVRLMTFVAGERSVNAAHAMLCAGEQGAAWEMHDALFARYEIDGADAYLMDNIRQIAAGLGLDDAALAECITSNRYSGVIAGFSVSFYDLGLTGTPSMLVRYSETDEWTKLDDRGLDNLLMLTADANE